jgi:hypothetical protein
MAMRCQLLLWAAIAAACLQAQSEMADLLQAYATSPDGYPTGKEFAKPDLSVPYRWHSYNKEAIERFDDAKMAVHVEPYNPVEDGGVAVPGGSGAQFKLVSEHAAKGAKSAMLRRLELRTCLRAARTSFGLYLIRFAIINK